MKKLLLLLFFLPFTVVGQTQNVTFQLDMNPYTGTFTAVEVFGTFNNFQGGVSVMTDADMDGVYDITIPLTEDSIEFVYAIDTASFAYIVEDFGVNNGFPNPPPCTKRTGQFTNRFLIINSDTTLPAYCWESCVVCGGTPLTADVTFQVDMSEYSGPSFSQVNLNGTFNNFCGTCAVMTDSDNDMVYELTVNLSTMDTAEYLFTLDGFSTGLEQFPIGAICTKTTITPTDTFTNRYFAPNQDTTLSAVCWNSCSPCLTGFEGPELRDLVKVYPNPSEGFLKIGGLENLSNELSITVWDVHGRRLESYSSENKIEETLDLTNLSNGIYLISFDTGKETWSETIVINR